DWLAIGLANTIATLGPDRIVIGGGIVAAGDAALEPIRRHVCSRVTLVPADEIQIVAAEHGPMAGAVGAALAPLSAQAVWARSAWRCTAGWVAPVRVSPTGITSRSASSVRAPPAAFLGTRGETDSRIRIRSGIVAPDGAKPVDVFTKSAPADSTTCDARRFSLSSR